MRNRKHPSLAGFLVLTWALASLLLGCTPAQNAATPAEGVATLPTAQGTVTITSPLAGSTIFAEALFVSGTAADVPADRFRLIVTTTDDAVLADTSVTVENGVWGVELVHEYTGDPVEALIVAQNSAGDNYDAESVVIASMDDRPEGTFGLILEPQPDAVVGGDQIEVVGTGSGLFENTLIMQLREPDGTVIAETIVTIDNPYFVDERVWVADLATEGHTGPASILIGYESAENGDFITLDETEIMVSEVAG